MTEKPPTVRRLTVRLGEDAFGEEALVSTHDIGKFRAVRAAVLVDGEAAVLSRQAVDVLGVREGDLVKVKSA